ncbi:notch-regulated ankyrin repeat-containing protein-like [Stylophora pistillata]|uniref:Notch-regulated ankyrin repeat-containing protein n=1 Tax=Stylophora pistillata TaxID=50429 RepID=A0A2B4RQP0_STYPI|nr:notch-regulated ankyrin repeat-containing protein-like [Stylophora pistillata]PFX19486.1 Notch-regulated ankyrin repeat-containing protein [Stylophora pistillata]
MQRQNLTNASLIDTREKQRAFQDAVNRKDREEVHRLLSNGLHINALNEAGDTALHQCIRDGRIDSAKLLVEFGADIKRTNRDGWSPVHLATTLGQRDLVMFLLDK